MQGENKGDLPKRSRLYQAELDISSIKPGDDFAVLKPSYVIFICDFDPFGKGLYRYTFEQRCREIDFPLEDGATRIFLNLKGRNPAEVPEELVHFLQYVNNSCEECMEQTQDAVVRRIHTKVTELKRNREWKVRYMTLGEYLDDEVRKATKEAVEKAAKNTEERLAKLITRMVESGEADKLSLLSKGDFRREMYKKYQL